MGKQNHRLGSMTFSHLRMSRKAPSNFVVPVPSSAPLSTCIRAATTSGIFVKLHIGDFFLKSMDKRPYFIKTRHKHRNLYIKT